MRILFITSRLPFPPDRGDRLRVFNFIKHLSPNHNIDLLTFFTNEDEESSFSELNKLCDIHPIYLSKISPYQAIITKFRRAIPLQVLYYQSKKMEDALEALIARNVYDVIYVHLFRLAPYVEDLNAYRILDLTDVISDELALSIKYRKFPINYFYHRESRMIREYERSIWRKFDEVWLISDSGKESLGNIGDDHRFKVIPNGVDINVLHADVSASKDVDILFLGHMGVFHNIDAAHNLVNDILPLVRKKNRMPRVNIVGASPVSSIVELGREPGINITGYVDDLNYEFNRSKIFVAPLRFAAGTQNKILEAMAAGVPVITSPVVNNGLRAKDGIHLVIAETDEGFANSIIRLLNNPEERTRIGNAGRDFVSSKYSWDIVRKRVEEIQKELSDDNSKSNRRHK